MKLLWQFCLILLISFAGEAVHALLPLPIPASVYGLVLLLICLCTGVIKLPQVRDAAAFLIEIMPVMFIPAAVGLMDSFAVLRPVLIPVCIITAAVTVIVMGVTGQVTQIIIRRGKKAEQK